MKKIIFQLILFVGVFVIVWMGVSKIDWLRILDVSYLNRKTEQKLGDLSLKFFNIKEKHQLDTFIVSCIDTIVGRICENNLIDTNDVKIHFVNSNVVNAFALPDGHLIIYSGLIKKMKNQNELAGVLAHEIAHIQLKHVKKKLIKELGLSVLMYVVSVENKDGGMMMHEMMRLISSSAFDRSLEKEADLHALRSLMNSKIDPRDFCNFLFNMGVDEDMKLVDDWVWFSTHPENKIRAKYLEDYLKNLSYLEGKVLDESTWKRLRSML